MEYGRLIQDAWTMAWRHRFLWLLAVFAGGGGGFSFSYGGGGSAPGGFGGDQAAPEVPGVGAMAGQIGQWIANNIGLILLLAGVVVLIGLVVLIVSLIAQGGMAQSTADLATGRDSSLGRAWRAGLALFWRYVGLWLVLIGIGILVAAVFGALIAAVFLAASGGEAPRVGALVGLALLAVPVFLIGLALTIAVSIIVAYAQRAIAIQDMGPIQALGEGWRTLRGHLGTSLLLWLISLVLGIAAGIGVAIVIGLVVAVLGGLGVALWAIFEFAAPTLVYIGLAALVALVALLVAIGAVNAYFWAYWTLAYLRLRPELGPEAAVETA